jgi:serine/threonine protein kinase
LNIDEVAKRVVRWAGQESNSGCSSSGSMITGHVGGDYPSYFDQSSRSFINNLLKINPTERMTIDECTKHPFLLPKEGGEEQTYVSIDNVYESIPPVLPPLKEGASSSDGASGEWSKRSFSLIVAPLPSKFVRDDGSSCSKLPIEETEQERNMSWVPKLEQTMMLSMPIIHEGSSSSGSSSSGSSSSGSSSSGSSSNITTVSTGERKEQSNCTSMLPPMSRFPGRTPGPVRSTSRFSSRSGTRMIMTKRLPLSGSRIRLAKSLNNKTETTNKSNKLFVKGLDLTAG